MREPKVRIAAARGGERGVSSTLDLNEAPGPTENSSLLRTEMEEFLEGRVDKNVGYNALVVPKNKGDESGTKLISTLSPFSVHARAGLTQSRVLRDWQTWRS